MILEWTLTQTFGITIGIVKELCCILLDYENDIIGLFS